MNFTNIHSLPKVVTTALDYAKGLYSAGRSATIRHHHLTHRLKFVG